MKLDFPAIKLSADEIRELSETYPPETVGARYSLQLLERAIEVVSDQYGGKKGFADLLESLDDLGSVVKEGYNYIDRYQSIFEDDDDEGAIWDDDERITGRDIDDYMREVAERLEYAMDLEPNFVEEHDTPDWAIDLGEQEMVAVWAEVMRVGYNAYHVLIGADNELFERYFTEPFLAVLPVESLEQLAEIQRRALEIALADWPTPTQRCAAITIALACLVSPEKLTVAQTRDGGLSVQLNDFRVDMPSVPVHDNFRWRPYFRIRDNSGALRYHALSDLDALQTPDSHARLLSDLRRHWTLANNGERAAALLAITWARLQGIPTSANLFFCVTDGNEGTDIACPELGVEVHIRNGAIERVSYPGLTSDVVLSGAARKRPESWTSDRKQAV